MLDKGINAAGDQVDRVLGITGKSVRNNITGRLMMNYVDICGLCRWLFRRNKALRTADLIQLNMQRQKIMKFL